MKALCLKILITCLIIVLLITIKEGISNINMDITSTRRHSQWLVDSKEKRACNLVHIKIQTEAKYSNKLCISYSTKAGKVTKN